VRRTSAERITLISPIRQIIVQRMDHSMVVSAGAFATPCHEPMKRKRQKKGNEQVGGQVPLRSPIELT
jgi:hypothetical protein